MGSNGDVNGQGGYGNHATYSSPIALSGKGGSSLFGEGGGETASVNTTGRAGFDAQSYGAGGSGAANGASVPVTRNGGAGKGGIAVIREYA